MSIGLNELIVIVILAILLIKPEKLGEYMSKIKKGMSEFNKTKSEIQGMADDVIASEDNNE